MSDAIVVGGGLFGCTIAAALQEVAGMDDVVVVDDRRPLAGSRPSGCLMRPSWFSGFPPGAADAGLELLGELYGVETIQFSLPPTRMLVPVYHVPRERILQDHRLEFVEETVHRVEPGVVSLRDDWTCEAPLVVVAAGYWSDRLVPGLRMEGKQGISHTWDGHVEPSIRPWAPYKQVVQFDESPGRVWAGDGTAIKPGNWSIERELASLVRVWPAGRVADQVFVAPPGYRAHVGIRPIVKDAKPCHLQEVSRGLWVATGGGKNGLLAAGWCASEIVGRVA